MNTVQNNEQHFYAELSATPPMPDCYTGVSRHIRQKKTVMRTLWAVAATLVLTVGLLPHHSATTPASQPAMVAAEVTEEINHVQTLFADDYSSTETASYSLVNNDSY